MACGKQARKLRYISNAIVVSDAVTRLKRTVRTINESVTGTDSIYRRLFAFRRLNKPAVVITDSVTKQAKKLRYIREGALTTTDAIAIAHLYKL